MVWFGLEYPLIFTSELPLTCEVQQKDPNLKITEKYGHICLFIGRRHIKE